MSGEENCKIFFNITLLSSRGSNFKYIFLKKSNKIYTHTYIYYEFVKILNVVSRCYVGTTALHMCVYILCYTGVYTTLGVCTCQGVCTRYLL